MHCLNRSSQQGGGDAILVRSDIQPQVRPIDNLENDEVEILWIKILTKPIPTAVGIFYGPQEN